MLIKGFHIIKFGAFFSGSSDVPNVDKKQKKNVLLHFLEVRPFIFLHLPDYKIYFIIYVNDISV